MILHCFHISFCKFLLKYLQTKVGFLQRTVDLLTVDVNNLIVIGHYFSLDPYCVIVHIIYLQEN